MENLFMSYRRDDAADAAGRIDDRLWPRFGREHVFVARALRGISF